MDNTFIQQKLIPRLTFNPGLALIGFRTTRPSVFRRWVSLNLPNSFRVTNKIWVDKQFQACNPVFGIFLNFCCSCDTLHVESGTWAVHCAEYHSQCLVRVLTGSYACAGVHRINAQMNSEASQLFILFPIYKQTRKIAVAALFSNPSWLATNDSQGRLHLYHSTYV